MTYFKNDFKYTINRTKSSVREISIPDMRKIMNETKHNWLFIKREKLLLENKVKKNKKLKNPYDEKYSIHQWNELNDYLSPYCPLEFNLLKICNNDKIISTNIDLFSRIFIHTYIKKYSKPSRRKKKIQKKKMA